jgi:hypothetical protein
LESGKAVDYLWVGLAGFAILAAASQVRAIIATDTLKVTESQWNDETRRQTDNAKGMRDVLCRNMEKAEEAIKGCKWVGT